MVEGKIKLYNQSRVEKDRARGQAVTRLAILGAGGHGRVAAEIAALTGFDRIVFFDSAWPARCNSGPWPVVGTDADLFAPGGTAGFEAEEVFVGLGQMDLRRELQLRLQASHKQLATLIHPRAIVSDHVQLGPGSLVAAGAVVVAFSRLGQGVIVNTAASVDHDCNIGDFVHVAPGAHVAADVTIGAGSWIGVGAVLRNGVRVGAGATVGAGAVVVSNVADNTTVIGVPARPIE